MGERLLEEMEVLIEEEPKKEDPKKPNVSSEDQDIISKFGAELKEKQARLREGIA